MFYQLSFSTISIHFIILRDIPNWAVTQHLCHQFHTEDLDKPRHFLRIEVAQFNNKIIISQMKYVTSINQ